MGQITNPTAALANYTGNAVFSPAAGVGITVNANTGAAGAGILIVPKASGNTQGVRFVGSANGLLTNLIQNTDTADAGAGAIYQLGDGAGNSVSFGFQGQASGASLTNGPTGAAAYLASFSAIPFSFGTNGIERLRITAVGGVIVNQATSGDSLTIAPSITTGALLATNTALTNNAAAAAGTLLNAPVAGNPTKWFPINDNGTIRNVPCW